MHVCVCMCAYVYMCVCVCMCLCVHVYVCVCVLMIRKGIEHPLPPHAHLNDRQAPPLGAEDVREN